MTAKMITQTLSICQSKTKAIGLLPAQSKVVKLIISPKNEGKASLAV